MVTTRSGARRNTRRRAVTFVAPIAQASQTMIAANAAAGGPAAQPANGAAPTAGAPALAAPGPAAPAAGVPAPAVGAPAMTFAAATVQATPAAQVGQVQTNVLAPMQLPGLAPMMQPAQAPLTAPTALVAAQAQQRQLAVQNNPMELDGLPAVNNHVVAHRQASTAPKPLPLSAPSRWSGPKGNSTYELACDAQSFHTQLENLHQVCSLRGHTWPEILHFLTSSFTGAALTAFTTAQPYIRDWASFSQWFSDYFLVNSLSDLAIQELPFIRVDRSTPLAVYTTKLTACLNAAGIYDHVARYQSFKHGLTPSLKASLLNAEHLLRRTMTAHSDMITVALTYLLSLEHEESAPPQRQLPLLRTDMFDDDANMQHNGPWQVQGRNGNGRRVRDEDAFGWRVVRNRRFRANDFNPHPNNLGRGQGFQGGNRGDARGGDHGGGRGGGRGGGYGGRGGGHGGRGGGHGGFGDQGDRPPRQLAEAPLRDAVAYMQSRIASNNLSRDEQIAFVHFVNDLNPPPAR